MDEGIIARLGENETTDLPVAAPIHNDVALRLTHILQNGLDVKRRKEMMDKYPPASNCLLSRPPKVNPEVKTSVLTSAATPDTRLVTLQDQIGACLSAVGCTRTHLLVQEEGGERDDRKLIEQLSDTGRLLANIHHSESMSRRKLMEFGINKKFKETLEDAPLGEWLFGDDLGERLKAAKALERSTSDLKSVAANKPLIKSTKRKPYRALNSYRPSSHRYPPSRPDGRKQQKYPEQPARAFQPRPRSPQRWQRGTRRRY